MRIIIDVPSDNPGFIIMALDEISQKIKKDGISQGISGYELINASATVFNEPIKNDGWNDPDFAYDGVN